MKIFDVAKFINNQYVKGKIFQKRELLKFSLVDIIKKTSFLKLNPCGENYFCDPAGKMNSKMVSWSICSPERHGLRRYSNLVAKERENTPLSDGHVEMSANVHNFWKMSTKENLPIFKFFPQNRKLKISNSLHFDLKCLQMSSNVFLSYLKLNFLKKNVYLDLFLQEKAFSQNRKKNFLKKNPDIKISQISYFFSRGYPEIFNPGFEIYDKK